MTPKHPLNSDKGVTLVEIIIAMVIVAAIAIFTIPKVLTVSQNSDDEKWKRTVKQAAIELQAAYSQYRQNNRAVTATTTAGNITPYINYVKIDTVRSYDYAACGAGTNTCSVANKPCLILKNGASVEVDTTEFFNGTGKLNAFKVKIDPDGKVTNGSGDDGKMVVVYLYYNGRIKTRGTIDANTTSSNWTDSPNPGCDPNWWSWD